MNVRDKGAFIGRLRELDLLGQALERARGGVGSIALIAGEAGIGKTRLVSEFVAHLREDGLNVMLGRCVDLVGTELPFQPFTDALRPHVQVLPWMAESPEVSQRRVFEQVLALLTKRSDERPQVVVLEDLHWADDLTLDLVVFLAQNLETSRILFVVTYRAENQGLDERMGRLRENVRHSASAVVLDLEPLSRDELATMLNARGDGAVPAALTDTIFARSEGNPFFAEELFDAAGPDGATLPRSLRDLLLQRIARLDRAALSVLRVAASAGREVDYALLRAVAGLPEGNIRESLRAAVDHGVLLADQATGTFRFRHALLAEAVHATILPGEAEEYHARIADQLARAGAPATALAAHWAAAGRATEAFTASIEAASEAEAAFGLAEALAHLERALSLWDAVPGAAARAGFDLAELTSWAAGLASTTGAALRAVGLGRQAVDLIGTVDPVRASRAHDRLGAYLAAAGEGEAGLAATRRAVEMMPTDPPSAQRADLLASLANRLMLMWRHEESLAVAERALALARDVDARRAELVARAMLGLDLAYLGRGEEGVTNLRSALRIAEDHGGPTDLQRVNVWLTDVLTMLGRTREAAQVAAEALERLAPFGIDDTGLVTNYIDALVALGEWDQAESVSGAAVRAATMNWPHLRLVHRAELEVGRGQFDDAHVHLAAARPRMAKRIAHGGESFDLVATELALWEHRWLDADRAVRDGLSRARSREAAFIRVQLCALGLRACAELAALARARRDRDELDRAIAQAQVWILAARRAARDAADITPNAAAWLALAEAEHERAQASSRAEAWSTVAAMWDERERPALAAYCRLRQGEALVAAGASRINASVPLRAATAVAEKLQARPLLHELTLLAERARLDLRPRDTPSLSERQATQQLGLTAREAEVLTLVGRGYTNREIADTLVISVKTASVHVSNILRKLDAPSRRDAAAIAHRITPPVDGRVS